MVPGALLHPMESKRMAAKETHRHNVFPLLVSMVLLLSMEGDKNMEHPESITSWAELWLPIGCRKHNEHVFPPSLSWSTAVATRLRCVSHLDGTADFGSLCTDLVVITDFPPLEVRSDNRFSLLPFKVRLETDEGEVRPRLRGRARAIYAGAATASGVHGALIVANRLAEASKSERLPPRTAYDPT